MIRRKDKLCTCCKTNKMTGQKYCKPCGTFIKANVHLQKSYIKRALLRWKCILE